MRTANGQSVFLTGHVKDTKKETGNLSLHQQFPKLFSFLDGTPSLEFSPKGFENICSRFGINKQTLTECIAEQERLDEQFRDTIRAAGKSLTKDKAAEQKAEEGQALCK
jgi:hypothetical protein